MVVYTQPTTATAEGIVRSGFLQRFLRESNLGDYGTVASGAVNTITDTTKLQSSQFSDREWTGGWARISYDAGDAAAAPEGQIRPIVDYEPGAGRITVSPNFTAAPASSDKYELWKFPNPQTVLDFLDQILKNDIFLPCWTMLSEVADYDMEQSHTTDWTASNATVTKVTNEPRLRGARALSVVTTSANGYAASNSIKVEPGKGYEVSALCMATEAGLTLDLIAWDDINGVEIDSKTGTHRYPGVLHFTFTAPSGCTSVSIRLANVENSKTSRWDEVAFRPVDARSIALPWWVKDQSQVRGIFKLKTDEIKADTWAHDLVGYPETNRFIYQDSAFGRGVLRLVSNRHIIDQLFIFGTRQAGTFANDNTDTKLVDEDYLLAMLCAKTFHYLANLRNTGTLNREWILERAKFWDLEAKRELRSQQQRIETVVQEVITGEFIDQRFTRA